MTDQRIWVVTDSPIDSGTEEHLVLWNEFAGHDSPHTSLPSLIRHDREHFRDAILRALDRLAAHQVDGRSLATALELESGLSYLHMTLVWAKRWGELGVLPDAVKLIALTERLRRERPMRVDIRVSDDKVALAIANTCARLGIACNQVVAHKKLRWSSIRAFRHLMRWFTFSSPSVDVTNFVIADYLFRVDPREIAAGRFASGYWSNLPESVEREGRAITWLHRFTPHPAIPSPREARKLVRNLAHHHLLDQVNGIRAAWQVVRTYRRIGRLKVNAGDAFVIDDSDLWPIFEEDWNESFHGSHPMSVAINLVNLQRLLPVGLDRTVLYIYENQPWEFALRQIVGADSLTIAVPHATVRFWDLRYFVGSASRALLPSHVAVNSEIARNELLHGGYPPGSLHDVEALMYTHPTGHRHVPTERRGILVLGELEVASTQRYLDWVIQLAEDRPVTFKPHPLVDASVFSFDGSQVCLSTESAEHLLASAEVVVLGASGTATLEAIARGTPVIAVLNPRELDLSVVGNHPLVRQIATEAELATALDESLGVVSPGVDVFFVDPSLPRWTQLLKTV